VIFITQNLDDIKFDVQAKRFIVYENTPGGIKKNEGASKRSHTCDS